MTVEMPSSLSILQIILVATIAIGVSGGLLAWRERPQPGAVPLAFFMAGQSWWSATLFFRITATGLEAKIFWVDISWAGIVIIPVAWLLFSLEYTGYSQYVTRRNIALLSIIPVITAVLGFTDGYHSLLYTEPALVERNGVLILDRTPNIWFWVIAGYTYLLGLAGVLPLLEFVSSRVDTFRGQSFMVLIGLAAPWITNALFLAGVLPTSGIDPTPVAFSVSGIAFLSALTRFRLFGTNPTPIRQARRRLFQRTQEGAIILDRESHIVDLNDRAAAILQTTPTDVLGRSMEAVLPELNATITDQSRSDRRIYRPENDHSNIAYDVSINSLVDARERVIGQIVTLHDISDLLQQQQRLELLHRVLRHNLRTNLQVIIGNINNLSSDDEELATKIRGNAWEIEQLSAKIRKVLDVFEQQRAPAQPVRLRLLLEDHIETVRDNYPDVVVHSDLAIDDVSVDTTFNEVFRNVIENAAKHNSASDPQVWVEVERDEDSVQVTVLDNGPGISEQELMFVREGTETPLKHGSGVGLALITWGTEIAGGHVTFEGNDPTGTVVIVEAPILPDDTRDDDLNRERSA